MERLEQRRYLNKKIIKQRLDLLRHNDNHRPDASGKTYYEHMKEEPHRLAKQHPYDCGNPKCLCCHLEKVMRYKSTRDKKLDARMKDDLETFENSP